MDLLTLTSRSFDFDFETFAFCLTNAELVFLARVVLIWIRHAEALLRFSMHQQTRYGTEAPIPYVPLRTGNAEKLIHAISK